MKRAAMALVVLVSGAAAGEPSHECAGSNPEPLMTAVEMACEDDEIQYGLRCDAEGVKLLALSSEAIACEDDEIQFGIRCEAEEVKPLALLSSDAIACEADEIQFGFRP